MPPVVPTAELKLRRAFRGVQCAANQAALELHEVLGAAALSLQDGESQLQSIETFLTENRHARSHSSASHHHDRRVDLYLADAKTIAQAVDFLSGRLKGALDASHVAMSSMREVLFTVITAVNNSAATGSAAVEDLFDTSTDGAHRADTSTSYENPRLGHDDRTVGAAALSSPPRLAYRHRPSATTAEDDAADNGLAATPLPPAASGSAAAIEDLESCIAALSARLASSEAALATSQGESAALRRAALGWAHDCAALRRGAIECGLRVRRNRDAVLFGLRHDANNRLAASAFRRLAAKATMARAEREFDAIYRDANAAHNEQINEYKQRLKHSGDERDHLASELVIACETVRALTEQSQDSAATVAELHERLDAAHDEIQVAVKIRDDTIAELRRKYDATTLALERSRARGVHLMRGIDMMMGAQHYDGTHSFLTAKSIAFCDAVERLASAAVEDEALFASKLVYRMQAVVLVVDERCGRAETQAAFLKWRAATALSRARRSAAAADLAPSPAVVELLQAAEARNRRLVQCLEQLLAAEGTPESTSLLESQATDHDNDDHGLTTAVAEQWQQMRSLVTSAMDSKGRTEEDERNIHVLHDALLESRTAAESALERAEHLATALRHSNEENALLQSQYAKVKANFDALSGDIVEGLKAAVLADEGEMRERMFEWAEDMHSALAKHAVELRVELDRLRQENRWLQTAEKIARDAAETASCRSTPRLRSMSVSSAIGGSQFGMYSVPPTYFSGNPTATAAVPLEGGLQTPLARQLSSAAAGDAPVNTSITSPPMVSSPSQHDDFFSPLRLSRRRRRAASGTDTRSPQRHVNAPLSAPPGGVSDDHLARRRHDVLTSDVDSNAGIDDALAPETTEDEHLRAQQTRSRGQVAALPASSPGLARTSTGVYAGDGIHGVSVPVRLLESDIDTPSSPDARHHHRHRPETADAASQCDGTGSTSDAIMMMVAVALEGMHVAAELVSDHAIACANVESLAAVATVQQEARKTASVLEHLQDAAQLVPGHLLECVDEYLDAASAVSASANDSDRCLLAATLDKLDLLRDFAADGTALAAHFWHGVSATHDEALRLVDLHASSANALIGYHTHLLDSVASVRREFASRRSTLNSDVLKREHVAAVESAARAALFDDWASEIGDVFAAERRAARLCAAAWQALNDLQRDEVISRAAVQTEAFASVAAVASDAYSVSTSIASASTKRAQSDVSDRAEVCRFETVNRVALVLREVELRHQAALSLRDDLRATSEQNLLLSMEAELNARYQALDTAWTKRASEIADIAYANGSLDVVDELVGREHAWRLETHSWLLNFADNFFGELQSLREINSRLVADMQAAIADRLEETQRACADTCLSVLRNLDDEWGAFLEDARCRQDSDLAALRGKLAAAEAQVARSAEAIQSLRAHAASSDADVRIEARTLVSSARRVADAESAKCHIALELFFDAATAHHESLCLEHFERGAAAMASDATFRQLFFDVAMSAGTEHHFDVVQASFDNEASRLLHAAHIRDLERSHETATADVAVRHAAQLRDLESDCATKCAGLAAAASDAQQDLAIMAIAFGSYGRWLAFTKAKRAARDAVQEVVLRMTGAAATEARTVVERFSQTGLRIVADAAVEAVEEGTVLPEVQSACATALFERSPRRALPVRTPSPEPVVGGPPSLSLPGVGGNAVSHGDAAERSAAPLSSRSVSGGTTALLPPVHFDAFSERVDGLGGRTDHLTARMHKLLDRVNETERQLAQGVTACSHAQQCLCDVLEDF